MLESLQIQDLTIHYNTSLNPLFERLSANIPAGWTGIIGANGIGKSTLLKVITDDIEPDSMTVSGRLEGPTSRIWCRQECEHPPPEGEPFLASLYEGDGVTGGIASRLHIGNEWLLRWESLSFGERKRFQIAVALGLESDLLAVDEPTNHLDEEGREYVLTALSRYRGIGLLVSHDRDLIDALCSRCLFIRDDGVRLRPGGVSRGLEEEQNEHLAERREYEYARAAAKALEKEAAERRRLAESQQVRRSKRGLDIKDHDARFKRNRARISGKDGTGGKLLRQLDGRIAQATHKMEARMPGAVRKSGISVTGMSTRRDAVVRLPETRIDLGERVLIVPDLTVEPGMRVALTGRNGSGKSTLIRSIVENSQLSPGDTLYVPQELTVADRAMLRERFELLPKKEKGRITSAFSRLGSKPEALLEGSGLSPGEARKLLIAFGLDQNPELIILDEPTNHMDIDSIQAIESALREAVSAMIIASHDVRFRAALTNVEWRIEDHPGGVVLREI